VFATDDLNQSVKSVKRDSDEGIDGKVMDRSIEEVMT
jgi:hypothetical protein